MKKGYFLLSLDFELMWGVKDKKTIQEYGRNILGARCIIPEILKLFQERNVHCTWAIVGLLFSENMENTLSLLPKKKPSYSNQKLSSYEYLVEMGNSEKVDPYHYADSLIQLLQQSAHQEIASHTFSHYYCLEDGQTKEEFKDDIYAAKNAAKRYGIDLKSLVLPRNQINPDYIDVLHENNIFAYRGTEKNWMYKTAKTSDECLFKRICRLLDSYVNLTGHNCYTLDEIRVHENLLNIPSSRFLRPYSHMLRHWEWLKLKRIKSQMKHAAKEKLVFHLWWHPHNFGSNIQKNMRNLVLLLDYYEYLARKYGLESKNMKELSEVVLQDEDHHVGR